MIGAEVAAWPTISLGSCVGHTTAAKIAHTDTTGGQIAAATDLPRDAGGRIVASGGPELALQLEAEGYDKYVGAAA